MRKCFLSSLNRLAFKKGERKQLFNIEDYIYVLCEKSYSLSGNKNYNKLYLKSFNILCCFHIIVF
jgi:hypothetical protein